jgi:3-oxoacyl-[acyl-carrier protein] reductase
MATKQTFEDIGVLVTGAGRGIGKRLAIGFAAAGARVGLLARSKTELDLTQLEIDHTGGKAIRLRADVRNPEQLQASAERMRAHFGAIHVLVHAAGIQGPIGQFVGADPEAWSETIETNLTGAARTCRCVLPEMIERRQGKIVLLCGKGGDKPRPAFSAYAASQAALLRFAETLAEEVRDHNVQVNCMSPGGTYTHMTDQILRSSEAAGEEEYEEALQIRVTGGESPDSQLALAMFLASERSNHISGKSIGVEDLWTRLERSAVSPRLYTLRRVQRV